MTFRCGHVGIVGRPNVGKSTLLNTLIGQKISITAPKPQTTRHSLIGVKTLPDAQILYVDTPGLHKDTGRAMSRVLNRTAQGILEGVDVIIFMIEGMRWTAEDAAVLDRLEHANVPVILAVNKVDLTADKEELLPFLQTVGAFYTFAEIIPISARKGSNLPRLEAAVAALLPEGEAMYDEETLTTSSSRFMAAEFIREQITRLSDGVSFKAVVLEPDRKAEIIRGNFLAQTFGKGQELVPWLGVTLQSQQERAAPSRNIALKIMLHLKYGTAELVADNITGNLQVYSFLIAYSGGILSP